RTYRRWSRRNPEIESSPCKPEKKDAWGGDSKPGQRTSQSGRLPNRERHCRRDRKYHKDHSRNRVVHFQRGAHVAAQILAEVGASVHRHRLQQQSLIKKRQQQENAESKAVRPILLGSHPSCEQESEHKIRSCDQTIFQNGEATLCAPSHHLLHLGAARTV